MENISEQVTDAMYIRYIQAREEGLDPLEAIEEGQRLGDELEKALLKD